MRVFRRTEELPKRLRGAALAIGNFDGIHDGHRAVVALARSAAEEMGAPLGVLMFDPPPRAFFQPDAPSNMIMDVARRAEVLEGLGVDFVIALAFDATVAGMTDFEFCQQVILEGTGAAAVSVGYDFRFGKARMGDISTLRAHGDAMGFKVLVAEQVLEAEEAEKAASTLIRRYIRDGELAAAARALHGYWRVTSNVEHGEKRGRTIGFPTANLTLKNFTHPRHGIYAVWVRLEGEEDWFAGVANFGRTPTTGLRDPLLEVFIFDWEGDIYGRQLEVAFVAFLREEAKFDSLDALVTQMQIDAKDARSLLAQSEKPA